MVIIVIVVGIDDSRNGDGANCGGDSGGSDDDDSVDASACYVDCSTVADPLATTT